MSPASRLLVVMALVLAWTTDLRADPFFRHDGAREPAREGWATAGSLVGMSAGPVDDAGTAAWNVRDPSTASGSTLTYRQVPDAQQLAAVAAEGWVLAARLRVVNPGPTPDAVDFSINVEYADGTKRFDLTFGSDADGANPQVRVGSGATHTVIDPVGDYHLYELVFDPVAGSAALLVDGLPTPITSFAGEVAGPAGTRVIWGGGQSSSTGEANYALVEWGPPRDVDADGIPDLHDDCPTVQNDPNVDTGGVGNGSGPDGIGDVCQCGDLGGNGRVDTGDALPIRQQLVDPDGAPLSAEEAARCNVIGEGPECDLADAIVIARRQTLATPPIEPVCAAALGFGLTCGDGVCAPDRETCRFTGPGACQADCGYCPSGAACGVDADCQTGYCRDGVCQSDPDAGAGSCGDGVCDPDEGCQAAPPGCQPDCGACPVDIEPIDSTEAERCRRDADCAEPADPTLRARCEPWRTCGGDPEDASCSRPSDCQDPFSFDFNPCDPVDGSGTCTTEDRSCISNGDCPSPAVCQLFLGIPPSGRCVASKRPDGSTCLENADCANGVCNVGFCWEQLQDDGTPCTTDAACASGVCFAGFCASIECGDGSCSAPAETCHVGGALACQTDCGGCPAGTPCTLNADCESGICNFGFCIGVCQGIGVPCTTTAACCSGTCDIGLCTGFCGDDTCSAPIEICGSGNFSGLVCETDCGKCPNGAPCDANADCWSGICNFGFCIGAAQPAGVPCTTDAACISGSCAGVCIQACGDGACDGTETCGSGNPLSCQSDCGLCSNGTPCTSSSDCQSNRCELGLCVPQPPPCDQSGNCPNGTSCDSDSDCSSDRCEYGVCVPDDCKLPGGSCSSNSDCCGQPWNDTLVCRNFGITKACSL